MRQLLPVPISWPHNLQLHLRAAQAVNQLQVESCMFVLYCVAMVKADSGASKSLVWSLLSSFHRSQSLRRATVNTLGISRWAMSLTSPHSTHIARRVRFDSQNQRRTGLEPSLFFQQAGENGLHQIYLHLPPY